MASPSLQPANDGAACAPFVPGEALLSAPVLAALALTAVNDHWGKVAAPGWITGKLSDFAGLYFFPYLAVALVALVIELVARVRGARGARAWRPSARGFAGLLVVEAAFFVALKTSPALAAWTGEAWSTLFGLRSRFVPDPTDLLALFVLPLAWRTARARGLLCAAPGARGGRSAGKAAVS